MEVPHAEVFAAAQAARSGGARVVLSVAPFAPLDPGILGDIDIIIVNEHEAEDFARHLGLPTGGAEATVAALAERLGRTVIATLGPEGAVAVGAEGVIRVPALPVIAGRHDRRRRHLRRRACRVPRRGPRPRRRDGLCGGGGLARLHQARRPAELPDAGGDRGGGDSVGGSVRSRGAL